MLLPIVPKTGIMSGSLTGFRIYIAIFLNLRKNYGLLN